MMKYGVFGSRQVGIAGPSPEGGGKPSDIIARGIVERGSQHPVRLVEPLHLLSSCHPASGRRTALPWQSLWRFRGGFAPFAGFGCIPQEIPLGWVGNEGSESLEQRRHRFAGAARRPALRTDPSSDPHLPPGRCIQSTNSQTYISRDHPGQAAGIRGPLRGFR